MIKFPYPNESAHPQYLWNRLEADIRELTQNMASVSCSVSKNTAAKFVTMTVNNPPDHIINYGRIEIENTIAGAYRFTTISGIPLFIYHNRNTRQLRADNKRPRWSSIMHGWYDGPDNRAIYILDYDSPSGYRNLDNPSSLFFYDNPPSTADSMEIINNLYLHPKNWRLFTLEAGSYRFEMKGGSGGKGGDSGDNAGGTGILIDGAGGPGAAGEEGVFYLNLIRPLSIDILLGGDGEDGKRGGYTSGACAWSAAPWERARGAGGGGCSGQDTIVRTSDGVLLFRVMGGAGGGGASIYYTTPFDSQYGSQVNVFMAGGGGGGGGCGQGGDGANYYTANKTNGNGGTWAWKNGDPSTGIKYKLGGLMGFAYSSIGYPSRIDFTPSNGTSGTGDDAYNPPDPNSTDGSYCPGGDSGEIVLNREDQEGPFKGEKSNPGGKEPMEYSSGFCRVYKLNPFS